MSDNLNIRFANKDDVSLILSLIKELATFEKLPHKVTATEQRLTDSLFGDHPSAEVIIMSLADEPVGFSLFFKNYSTFLGKSGLYLEDIYFKPEYRGRGFGKQVFKFLSALAKERNCERMDWLVLNWNESAINFYKKMNAEPMSEYSVFRLAGKALEEC